MLSGPSCAKVASAPRQRSAMRSEATAPRAARFTYAARCDVSLLSLNYATTGPKGENTNASGVLLLPSGEGCSAAECRDGDELPLTNPVGKLGR